MKDVFEQELLATLEGHLSGGAKLSVDELTGNLRLLLAGYKSKKDEVAQLLIEIEELRSTMPSIDIEQRFTMERHPKYPEKLLVQLKREVCPVHSEKLIHSMSYLFTQKALVDPKVMRDSLDSIFPEKDL